MSPSSLSTANWSIGGKYAYRLGEASIDTTQLNFFDNTVSQTTDTITLRGSVANPPLNDGTIGGAPVRELTDGEFVTVLLEGVEPIEVLTVPRAAG